MTRIQELKVKIAECDRSYWNFGVSAVADADYDKLKEELRRLTGEADHFIGAPSVVSSGRVEHPTPMLSMQKVYAPEKVLAWASRYKRPALVVMPKYDGIAVVRYNNGVIATRGDGAVGENITDTLASVWPEGFVGYGEAVILDEDFKALSDLGYKNPRNAVSGLLNAKDESLRNLARKFITIMPYRCLVFHVTSVTGAALAGAVRVIRKESGGIPTDGIVFRVADNSFFSELGHTDHHWRGQIALKYQNEAAVSVITAIEWNVRNGTLTPVARTAPVSLGGVEIKNVTLHNSDRVVDWDIRVGDAITIERAGGVIPKAVKTMRTPESAAGPTPIPTECPVCHSPLRKSGKRLYCSRGGCSRA